MKGMEEGYDPHMLDVARISDRSWDDVTEDTLARCWIKANVLPEVHQADIRNKSRKTKEVVKSEANAPTKKDLSTWIEIEDEDDVQEALVVDALQDEEEEERLSACEATSGCRARAICSIAHRNLQRGRRALLQTNKSHAAELIRKARHVLDTERRKRQGSNKRQIMLTEVWRKGT
eukprot:IDg22414t1